jgi:hypothetical protein
MAQHRDAPAFQEYAASMMAKTSYRVMSLSARGLLYTMRLECWVNGALPSDPLLLARVLGFAVDDVNKALNEVLSEFVITDDAIRCPELDDYRAHLDERRQRQVAGGKAGAAKTNSGRGRPAPGKPAGKPRVARESLVQNSQTQNSPNTAIRKAVVDAEWVSDFNEYERASRGG